MLRAAIGAGAACLLVSCTPSSPPLPPGAAPFDHVAAAAGVAGDWRWAHDTAADGTRRHERERWHLERDGLTRIRGHYLREVDVEIEAQGGEVFACNQRPAYRQQAWFDIAGVVGPGGVQLDEVAYQATPSPCDPGLRQLGSYHVDLEATGRIVLVGAASVTRLLASTDGPVAPPPPPPPTIDGAWSWSGVSWTGDGLVQREAERWQLEVHDTAVTGHYTRVVTLVRPDGVGLPCAGADRYQFVDEYQLTGTVTADGWRLREASFVAGSHPCLAGTPTRTVDEATAALDGEYLILSWRGPRKQVLARVPATAATLWSRPATAPPPRP